MPDLQEDLRALADRRAGESTGDFDSVLTTAHTRRRRRTAGLAVVGAAVVVAAVAVVPTLRPAQTQPPVADSPVPTNAVAPPRVSVQPSEQPVQKAGPLVLTSAKAAAPGGQFVASFPDRKIRGVIYSLASAAKPDLPLYTLLAKVPGDSTTPTSWKVTTSEAGIGVPAYTSAGPHTLAVPKGLAAGSYQVCTLSGPRLCGLLTVK